MMGLITTVRLIRKMAITILHWRRLTMLHWLLVEPTQKPTRLKHLIFQPTHGLKLQIILIILSKLTLFFKSLIYPLRDRLCLHFISAFMHMHL